MTILALLSASSAIHAQDGFVSLFNGKDLTGWKVGGDQSTFTVKNGAILSHGPVAHCFYDGPVQDHHFVNFELRVDVMTEPGSNGGVYFDTEFQDGGFPKKGFEDVQTFINPRIKAPKTPGTLHFLSPGIARLVHSAG